MINHYWKPALCRVSAALGKARNILDKGFAECHTRQRALGKELIGKEAFAECRKSTRQRFTLGKMKMRKKPKFFFGGGCHKLL